MTASQVVSKLEAARRQLETAVRLYFASQDDVAIHTLAAAAHQVLADLKKAQGGSPTISEYLLSFASPELRKSALRHIATPENFLKQPSPVTSPLRGHPALLSAEHRG